MPTPEKKTLASRYAAWTALVVVALVVSVETGGAVFRIFRSPAVLALLAAATGYAVFRKSTKKPKDTRALPAVNQILRIAREHQGRITAAEVLAETQLELEEVKTTLDELTYAGTCQLVVGEKGTQVYYFPEFEDAATKRVDVLDTSDAAEISRARQARETGNRS